MAAPDDLARLDRALLGVRRMWAAPTGIPHEGAVVEGSTLLVCLAVDEQPADVGIVDVSRALGVTHSTASRLVTRAVDSGMVQRHAPSADSRRAVLALTGDGARLVAASRAFRAHRLGHELADWPDDDVVALADLLSRLAAAVSASSLDEAARRPDRGRPRGGTSPPPEGAGRSGAR